MTHWSRLILLCLPLALWSCGGGSGGGSSTTPSTPTTEVPTSDSPLDPVVPSARYANELADCALVETTNNSCSLNTLPLLGMENSAPTVDDIMARTAVSHEWMGQRFREVLEQLPNDALLLFKGITVVVIASDVRPSYYYSLTGAIYLDPANLWLNNEEKATIEQDEDFRSGFGSELQFVSLWRYIKDGDYAWNYYPLDGTETRTINDIIYPMAQLLFHELAHANDFFDPSEIAGLNRNQSVYNAARSLENDAISTRLRNQQGLNSSLLYDLAEVLFRGEDASDSQKALTAEQVGLEFEIDGASDDYAYSSQFEDVAMLFEEVMMKYHFGVDRELAYTEPSVDARFCNDYTIRWGARFRTGLPLIQSRAEFVVQELLNKSDVADYIAALPDSQLMSSGENWCTIQNLSAKAKGETIDRSGELIRPDNIYRSHR